jgi:hypothetical protein
MSSCLTLVCPLRPAQYMYACYAQTDDPLLGQDAPHQKHPPPPPRNVLTLVSSSPYHTHHRVHMRISHSTPRIVNSLITHNSSHSNHSIPFYALSSVILVYPNCVIFSFPLSCVIFLYPLLSAFTICKIVLLYEQSQTKNRLGRIHELILNSRAIVIMSTNLLYSALLSFMHSFPYYH